MTTHGCSSCLDVIGYPPEIWKEWFQKSWLDYSTKIINLSMLVDSEDNFSKLSGYNYKNTEDFLMYL